MPCLFVFELQGDDYDEDNSVGKAFGKGVITFAIALVVVSGFIVGGIFVKFKVPSALSEAEWAVNYFFCLMLLAMLVFVTFGGCSMGIGPISLLHICNKSDTKSGRSVKDVESDLFVVIEGRKALESKGEFSLGFFDKRKLKKLRGQEAQLNAEKEHLLEIELKEKTCFNKAWPGIRLVLGIVSVTLALFLIVSISMNVVEYILLTYTKMQAKSIAVLDLIFVRVGRYMPVGFMLFVMLTAFFFTMFFVYLCHCGAFACCAKSEGAVYPRRTSKVAMTFVAFSTTLFSLGLIGLVIVELPNFIAFGGQQIKLDANAEEWDTFTLDGDEPVKRAFCTWQKSSMALDATPGKQFCLASEIGKVSQVMRLGSPFFDFCIGMLPAVWALFCILGILYSLPILCARRHFFPVPPRSIYDEPEQKKPAVPRRARKVSESNTDNTPLLSQNDANAKTQIHHSARRPSEKSKARPQERLSVNGEDEWGNSTTAATEYQKARQWDNDW
ncbi:putative LMBR1 domain-containing protein 1 [Blattamonas nauphoetae]|uniref:LMBR1 domain-containing protein 1 n=1 Tax=Blattamonas nauphoetae TaxID=2049346 RepID=A0ABQ9X6V8_9EUKA|nr:putative LMBR1 domain-containing protein 1 [Blattamonas nauphoetae]